MTKEEIDRISQMFFPESHVRQLAVERENRKFVHYTSAAAASSILQNKEFWMRDPICMNDFTEVEHGLRCLFGAYNGLKHGERFRRALNEIQSGLTSEIESNFNGALHKIRDCYLICVSEHKAEDDKVGRLSMWRAYGGSAGVAMVMNSFPFFHGPDVLKVYTLPVQYLEDNEFEASIGVIADNLEKEQVFLKTVERNTLMLIAINMMRYAALSTKHPGFIEEQEWRLIYSPGIEPSAHIKSGVEVIAGLPQIVQKIPLRNLPDGTTTGAELANLIDHVIIGPTQFSFALWKAFVRMLGDAGVEKPESKVFISGTPLR